MCVHVCVCVLTRRSSRCPSPRLSSVLATEMISCGAWRHAQGGSENKGMARAEGSCPTPNAFGASHAYLPRPFAFFYRLRCARSQGLWNRSNGPPDCSLLRIMLFSAINPSQGAHTIPCHYLSLILAVHLSQPSAWPPCMLQALLSELLDG